MAYSLQNIFYTLSDLILIFKVVLTGIILLLSTENSFREIMNKVARHWTRKYLKKFEPMFSVKVQYSIMACVILRKVLSKNPQQILRSLGALSPLVTPTLYSLKQFILNLHISASKFSLYHFQPVFPFSLSPPVCLFLPFWTSQAGLIPFLRYGCGGILILLLCLTSWTASCIPQPPPLF